MMTDQPPPAPPQNASSDDTSPGLPSIDVTRIETLLAHGQIVGTHNIQLWGSNYARLITVSDGELAVPAVYKPRRGERPLWDFPNGTLCNREVVSYLLSKALDWQLVPPTVLRSGPHGPGSVQLFIAHDPEINYFSLGDSFIPQLQRFAVFDYLANNGDRKGGHLLLDPNGKLWGIDHGLTFHAMPKLRTVIWEFAGQQIADDLLEPVRALLDQIKPKDGPLRREIIPLLSLDEVTALVRRAETLLDNQTYPEPGPGLHYPWPPV
jgi:uncharacterized repeat protein (TIGR03843 family)